MSPCTKVGCACRAHEFDVMDYFYEVVTQQSWEDQTCRCPAVYEMSAYGVSVCPRCGKAKQW